MLAGDEGLEPTHAAVKVLCLTDLANPLQIEYYKIFNLTNLTKKDGADDRNRTYNLLITSQLLCQLSHISMSLRSPIYFLKTNKIYNMLSLKKGTAGFEPA